MKLLSCLSLDQVGHAPGRPQAGAITQHLGPLFQASAQGLQLDREQPRFAARPAGLAEGFSALPSPGLMPAADRLAVHLQSPGDLPLAVASVEEASGFKPSPFQFVEIALNAFGIAHAQRLARNLGCVTILCEHQ